MSLYSMDLKMKAGAEEVQGQIWLAVHHPSNYRWSICSSVPALMGLHGNLNISEKLGFEGTTFFKNDETSERSSDGLFRLAGFRGGVIDTSSWDVGKGSTGEWLKERPPGVNKDFTWVIRKIDDRDTPRGTSTDASD